MTDMLPLFEGHTVETQRLKLSGKVDKDQWVAEAHDGDTIVWFVGKGRLGNVGHEFVEDGTIRIERIAPLDLHVQISDDDTIAKLYQDLAAIESEIRREKTGAASFDDFLDESQAADAALTAALAAGDDEVSAARAARVKKPAAKKTVAKPRKTPTKK